jgi:hypothetical protein
MHKAQCHANVLLAQEEDENMAFLVASFSLGLLGIIVTLMVGRKVRASRKLDSDPSF